MSGSDFTPPQPARYPGARAATPAPPLGLYIHAPFCRHICPYCDFYKVALPKTKRGARGRFVRAAIRELELLLGAHPGLAGLRPLASIYFGGGTPSSLEPAHLAAILDGIRARLPLRSDCEVTLEANPETLTPARLRAWRAAAINRLSIGVQSFNDRLLVKIGRGHTAALVRRALRRARRAGFDNLSLDLMFGLPGQTLDDWMASVEETIHWAPEHISFYGLTIHPETVFHQMHSEGRLPLPDDDLQSEMYLQARRRLIEAGYDHYEISNFARFADPPPSGTAPSPSYRARHNENYWLGGDWLALGPGAHGSLTMEAGSRPARPAQSDYSKLSDSSDQSALPDPSDESRQSDRSDRAVGAARNAAPVPVPLRWENPRSLEAWHTALRAHRLPRSAPRPLTLDERRTEAILLGLRRLEGLDLDALARPPLAFDLRLDRAAPLQRLLNAGLVHWSAPARLALTEKGLLVADSVMAELA